MNVEQPVYAALLIQEEGSQDKGTIMRADSFVMNMANMGCMGMCRMEGMLNKVRMKTAVRRYGG